MMSDPGAGDLSLADVFQDRKLDSVYWRSFVTLSAVSAIDYFDFFLVGFLVADFAQRWHLTYIKVAIILLAGGLGSIGGALGGGVLADRHGRKPVLFWGSLICGVTGGLMAIVPDGQWLLFSSLRLVVGAMVGSMSASVIAIIVELTPRRQRSFITGLNIVAPSVGILIASLTAGALLAHAGWRTLAAFGALPLLLLWPIQRFVPESVLWLISKGRTDAAHHQASAVLGRAVKLPSAAEPAAMRIEPAAAPDSLYSDPARFWLVLLVAIGSSTGVYGTYLWGPSILMAVAKLSPAVAASTFALVSVLAIIGKLSFSLLPQWTGRRPCGIFTLALGIVSLIGAALAGGHHAFGFPAVLLCFMGVGLSLDGGGANLIPYSAEVFPVRLASRGVGLSQAGSGLGKILGPLSLAIIAGSSDVMKPAATSSAITPAFLFLAALCALALVTMLVVPIETGGRKLALT